MYRMIIVLMFVLLSGCFFSKTDQIVSQPQTIVHQAWPEPIQPYTFNWKVIPVDDKVYVGLEYDESIDFRLFLEDMNRYIKESNSIICFYREELKEVRCLELDKREEAP